MKNAYVSSHLGPVRPEMFTVGRTNSTELPGIDGLFQSATYPSRFFATLRKSEKPTRWTRVAIRNLVKSGTGRQITEGIRLWDSEKQAIEFCRKPVNRTLLLSGKQVLLFPLSGNFLLEVWAKKGNSDHLSFAVVDLLDQDQGDIFNLGYQKYRVAYRVPLPRRSKRSR